MNPREIIAKAWSITKKERQLRHWGYVAAVTETLLNIKLLTYQTWLLTTYFREGRPIGLINIGVTIRDNLPFWLFLTLIIGLIILTIAEWLFPHSARGAIIGLGAKRYKNEEMKGGLVLAIYNFFPIFAIHEIFFFSRITVVITITSLFLRYGSGIAPIAITMLVFLYISSIIIRFFCIFAEEAVVIKKLGIGGSLKNSFKLVVSYLGQVVFLLLLFFMIVLRVILNAVMVLILPALVIGIGFVFALVMPPVISYSISTAFGLTIVGIASYFFAYLAVFKQTVWTITYMELAKLKELDIIELEKEEEKKSEEAEAIQSEEDATAPEENN